MKEVLEEVAALQRHWSEKNTPDMVRRGLLIRQKIPACIREFAKDLEAAIAIPGATIEVVGKDGTGRKTEIPWVRIFSPAHSPRPTQGWYVVLLFHATGEGLYLALVHGSTTWENGEFRPRATSEVDALLAWARATLGTKLTSRPDIQKKIELGSRRKLARAYERSTLAAFWYPEDGQPHPQQLRQDCITFARLLGLLYQAVDYGQTPGSTPPDIAEVLSATEAVAKGRAIRTIGGQGIGLTADERQAVEKRAMVVAKAYLVERGYVAEDVSLKESFDFLAWKDDQEIIVEVKGTTAGPSQILLTANEVDAHRARYPLNMLIVVYGIELKRGVATSSAMGGDVLTLSPWDIRQDALKPISFRYKLECNS